MPLVLDRSGTPVHLDEATFARWADRQRVFISSVMGPMASLRHHLADALLADGLQPVWFEEFGGRDDDAEVAYLSEVATSTIYLGVLGRDYGRIDRTQRLSATHAEYREAEKLGLHISVWIRDESDMLADQHRFVEEVQTFHTTGSFADDDGLVTKVRESLRRLAADDESPWAKLGDAVFRTRRVVDAGSGIKLFASVHATEVVAALEEMRPGRFGGQEYRLTWAGKSLAGRVMRVQTTTTSARSSEIEIDFEPGDQTGSFFGTTTVSVGGTRYTPEEVTALELRHILFGEERPSNLFGSSLRDFREDIPTGQVSLSLYQAMFALLATEALVESSRVARVPTVSVSPPGPDGRRVRITWTPLRSGGERPDGVSVSGLMRL